MRLLLCNIMMTICCRFCFSCCCCCCSSCCCTFCGLCLLSTWKDDRKFTEATRERENIENEAKLREELSENFVIFASEKFVQFPLTSPRSLPPWLLLPHSTHLFSLLIFDIFLGQHFQRVYFHVMSEEEKNTFSRFRFISYFSFLRLLSAFFLLACFLCAGHALARNWQQQQQRRHQAKF